LNGALSGGLWSLDGFGWFYVIIPGVIGASLLGAGGWGIRRGESRMPVVPHLMEALERRPTVPLPRRPAGLGGAPAAGEGGRGGRALRERFWAWIRAGEGPPRMSRSQRVTTCRRRAGGGRPGRMPGR